MAKTRGRPKYKKFIGFIYVAFSAILIYTLGVNGYRVVVQRGKLAELKVLKAELEVDKKELAKEVELLNDEDYVTRYARDNYVFPREGEEVIKLPVPNSKK